MAKRRSRFHPQVAEYLRNQMQTGSNTQRKDALQRLHQSLRRGFTLTQEDRGSIEITLLGLLNNRSVDEKVRRWALANLTLIGRPENCTNAITQIIKDFADEPRVLSAAVAALYRFNPENAGNLVSGSNAISPNMVTLAALQSTDMKQIAMTDISINIEKAESMELQQSLLLVGLDKAPPNLFDPNHSNAMLVYELGKHDHSMVKQYSVWAAAENAGLCSDDVGINLRELDGEPANVRSYAYRLIMGDKDITSLKHEIICMGSKDADHEARLGLSTGMSDNFYDGVPEITVDWFYDEEAIDIQSNLLDHIVSNSEKEPDYRRIAIEEFTHAANDRGKRGRMQASAAGTPLYSEFKRIEISEESSLFGSYGVNMTINNNNNTTNHGTIGALSQGGDVQNNGRLEVNLTTKQVAEFNNTLTEIERDIPSIPVIDDMKNEVLEATSNAQKDPSKGNMDRVIGVLEKANSALNSVEGMGKHAVKIAAWINSLGAILN